MYSETGHRQGEPASQELDRRVPNLLQVVELNALTDERATKTSRYLQFALRASAVGVNDETPRANIGLLHWT